MLAQHGAFFSMQVQTLEGKSVWRRRHYQVGRAKEPGTFHFSVHLFIRRSEVQARDVLMVHLRAHDNLHSLLQIKAGDALSCRIHWYVYDQVHG